MTELARYQSFVAESLTGVGTHSGHGGSKIWQDSLHGLLKQ